MNYPGLDPAIATALRARMAQRGPNFVDLPAPGGPVDEGISGPLGPSLKAALAKLNNHLTGFQLPLKAPSHPGADRMRAVTEAQRNAAQHLQRIQHKRRAGGPYGWR